MKDYFKRLKRHNGWGMLLLVTVLGILAGSGNLSSEVWWHGAIFGGLSAFLFCLFVILFTNGKE